MDGPDLFSQSNRERKCRFICPRLLQVPSTSRSYLLYDVQQLIFTFFLDRSVSDLYRSFPSLFNGYLAPFRLLLEASQLLARIEGGETGLP